VFVGLCHGGDGCDDDDEEEDYVGLVVYLTKMKTFSGIVFVFLLPVLFFCHVRLPLRFTTSWSKFSW
jgi:hypothetical protein